MNQPPAYAQGPPPAACHSKVELRISCKKLLDKDVLSKSDPLCVLFEMRGGRWTEVGRTERISNNLNPNFSRCIVIDYMFEQVQKIKFSVYDIDSDTQKLTEHDFLGSFETTLGEVVSHKDYSAPLKIKNLQAGRSTITIVADEMDNGPNETLYFDFSGFKLDKKDWFGKSDPYLEIFREQGPGRHVLIHKTEVVKNTLNPHWRVFKLTMQALSGGNMDSSLLIKCWDWDSDGSSDYIGEFRTTVRSLLEGATTKLQWDCINHEKRKKKGNKYTNSGVIHLNNLKIEKNFSFLDYIMGGCQINFTVAIDFTGSNGDPRRSDSLHFINPNYPNQYVSALRSVGMVCQDYDSDKMFPALGFGCKIPPTYQLSHEFPLNFNMQNPFCSGIQGVEMAYMNAIQSVQLYGPTNFAPVIRHVTKFAHDEAQKQAASNYFVLLILTDGEITDFEDTKEAIVNASQLPMSIIIVGVGNADFSKMDDLDGDQCRLVDRRGRPCARDIVQFVPYRQFANGPPSLLSQSVLAELPDQLVAHYKKRGLKPKKTNVKASAPPM